MNNKFLSFLMITVVFTTLFSISSPKAHAFSLGDIVAKIKSALNLDAIKGQVTITSQIALAPGGDLDKNDILTAGDFVQYTYTLTNTTKNTYHFATLKTNIDAKVVCIFCG